MSVAEHYESLLADHYSWMLGGLDEAVERNRGVFEQHGLTGGGAAVDLGAGPGSQSIALAQLGYEVLAVDISKKLLDELTAHAADLPVRTVCEDLLQFRTHCAGPVSLVACMGDTLTHLDAQADAQELFAEVHQALQVDGHFVLTFRDLSARLQGLDRFIPVRSSADTLFTCVLDYDDDGVIVSDLIYVRSDGGWKLHKSAYRKTVLSFDWVCQQLKGEDFQLDFAESVRGWVTIVASKKSSPAKR